MPTPVSATRSTSCAPSMSAETVTLPPRSVKLMAHGGEEARLGRVGLLGRAPREFERLLLGLPFGDAAHHGDARGSRFLSLHGAFERPAAHFDPDEVDLTGWTVLPAERNLPA